MSYRFGKMRGGLGQLDGAAGLEHMSSLDLPAGVPKIRLDALEVSAEKICSSAGPIGGLHVPRRPTPWPAQKTPTSRNVGVRRMRAGAAPPAMTMPHNRRPPAADRKSEVLRVGRGRDRPSEGILEGRFQQKPPQTALEAPRAFPAAEVALGAHQRACWAFWRPSVTLKQTQSCQDGRSPPWTASGTSAG